MCEHAWGDVIPVGAYVCMLGISCPLEEVYAWGPCLSEPRAAQTCTAARIECQQAANSSQKFLSCLIKRTFRLRSATAEPRCRLDLSSHELWLHSAISL